jgi:Ca2+-binding RTX toxin-like protein
LFGDAGIDILQGGADRDLLIGGNHGDTLTGGSGDDILIGGDTDHDVNVTALAAIMAEWTSGGAYLNRIDHLTNAVAGGLNDPFFLKAAGGTPAAATVYNDGYADTLTGGADQDWFFFSALDTKDDVLGETVTVIV